MTNPFFATSDGKSASEVGNTFDAGGDIEPIPSKTRLRALIDDAKWTTHEGDRYIELRWSVLEPESYKGRKVFQKIKVYDADPKKADKAKRMLAAIDANAGGGLVALGREPTEAELQQHLLNKIMLIQVQIWAIKDEQTGDTKKGNWVNLVASNSEPLANAEPIADGGDDIPF